MCQWIKKYFEIHYSGQEYDPVARRGGQDLHYILGGNKVNNMAKAGGSRANTGTTGYRPPTASQKKTTTTITRTIKSSNNADVELLEKQVAELSSNN